MSMYSFTIQDGTLQRPHQLYLNISHTDAINIIKHLCDSLSESPEPSVKPILLQGKLTHLFSDNAFHAKAEVGKCSKGYYIYRLIDSPRGHITIYLTESGKWSVGNSEYFFTYESVLQVAREHKLIVPNSDSSQEHNANND